MSQGVAFRRTVTTVLAMATASLLTALPAVAPATLAARPTAVYLDPVGPQVEVGGSVTLTAHRCPLPESGHGFGDDMLPGTDDDRCRRTKVAWSLRPGTSGTLSKRRGESTVFTAERTGRVTITADADGSRSSTSFEVQPEGSTGPGGPEMTELLAVTPEGLMVFTLPPVQAPELAMAAGAQTATGPEPIDVSMLPTTALPGNDMLVGAEFDPVTHQIIGAGASGSIYAFAPVPDADGLVSTLAATHSTLGGGLFAMDLDPRTRSLLLIDNGTASRVDIASGSMETGPPLGYPLPGACTPQLPEFDPGPMQPWWPSSCPGDPSPSLPPPTSEQLVGMPFIPTPPMDPQVSGVTSIPFDDGGSPAYVGYDAATGWFTGLNPVSGQMVGFAPLDPAVASGLGGADVSMDAGPDGSVYMAASGPASGTTTIYVVDPFSGAAIPMGTVPAQVLGMTVLSYGTSAVAPPEGSPPCQTSRLPGDFNGNGTVDAVDYEIWSQKDPRADGNLDGTVDGADLLAWLRNHGRHCTNLILPS